MTRSSFLRHAHAAPHRSLVVVIATLLLVGSAAFAHEPEELDAGWTAAERRIGHNHALTMPLVREMAAIGRDLNALAAQHPGTCQWMNQITGPETLARQVHAFNAYARVRQVIEAHLSVQQYLLTLYALNTTTAVVYAPAEGIAEPDGALARNIDFYKTNRAEIETLLEEPDPC